MADIDDNDITYQDASPATPPKGFKVKTVSVNGAHVQSVVPTDIHGHLTNVQAVADTISGDEYGLVTNAVIHGKSTAGGGSWVDVKVSPSGAVQIGGTLDTSTVNASTNAALKWVEIR